LSGSIEIQLLILAVLLLLSILASKVSDRVGVPALLLFLAIGMLAGSDGPGGIYFDNALLAQGVGVVALVIILYSGGLDTNWESIRPVLKAGFALALLGVLVTALIVGIAAHFLLDFTLLEGLLLGAIVSSTDAAAVFSILRARGVSLRGRLQPLLELESGSNDPMAVFLTIAIIQLLLNPDLQPIQLLPDFFIQMGIGALIGVVVGRLSLYLINRIQLGFEGLYPVLALTIALLTYGLAGSLGGSGFLAVYLAGLILGNQEFIHRRSLLRFYDGLAWLMQIAMFLTLGLLVFPSRLPTVVVPGTLIAAILIFVARPLGVFASLILTRMGIHEKAFIAWVGLRGAAPIVLATFPLLAGISRSDTLFNLVFFVVLTSVLLQGPSIPLVARWLRVAGPSKSDRSDPIEPGPAGGFHRQLRELSIQPGSPFEGKRIVELNLPEEFLVVLIDRNEDFVVPSGGSEIRSGDRLLVISDEVAFQRVRRSSEPGQLNAA
jgi:potassium/hydrogen antiporter